ncbi:Hypothetical protein, putative [Bodo saltans]|uniref:Uncharacterized protein n=1 Tax=Bodo saltans TaxID=75058 RepID=A0A0S4JG54_BODSA|nr:Hypothetical protein, putative [Bodo saltans]|eukprot:CUG88184.1 Hypothetical protein, putative [Bodo saltans]
MSEQRPTQIPNVVPLSALRHRQAVQYCFTPGYDVDGPVPRKKRTVFTATQQAPPSSALESPTLRAAMPEESVQYLRYPAENYEHEVSAEELRFFRQHCSERAAKVEKAMKKKASETTNTNASKKIIPAPPKVPVTGGNKGKLGVKERAAQAAEEQQRQLELSMSAYLCIGTEEPIVEVPTIEDGDVMYDDEVPEEASPSPAPSASIPQEQVRHMTLNIVDLLSTGTRSVPAPRPSGPRKLARTKSELQRPKLSLEENDSQKTVVDAQSGHPKSIRRLVYVPPPQENIPAWLPVVGMPEAPAPSPSKSNLKRQGSTVSITSPLRRMASSKQLPVAPPPGLLEKSGRFSPNGGFYIPATMDDEYYSASTVRLHRSGSQATAGPSAAEQAQQATFDRLARPNVVSESTTSVEEGRVLRFLASRRESVTPNAAAAAAISASLHSPSLSPAGKTPIVGNATPPAGSSLTLLTAPHPGRSPPMPPVSLGDGAFDTPRAAKLVTFVGGATPPSTLKPPAPPKPTVSSQPPDEGEALLTYRQSLPNQSRSNGCVGAAEIHYWLDMSQSGRTMQQKRDQDTCVAQVWMRRSLDEECHSARTVLRNYATRIPRDAVLAVTLRGVGFGQRDSDITITFSYGDCLRDTGMSSVAETIRKIVKDANNNDTARFRGPFLMCSASSSLCAYLRSYCLAMSSAEHPELAVLGFPGAQSRQTGSGVTPKPTALDLEVV